MKVSSYDRVSSNAFALVTVLAIALNVAIAYWITHYENSFMRELIGPLIFHSAVTWFAIRMGMSALTDVDDDNHSSYYEEVSRASFIMGMVVGWGEPILIYKSAWGYAPLAVVVVGALLWFFYNRILIAFIDSLDDGTAPAIPRDR